MEDCGGRQHPEAARIERHQGLQGQDDVAVDEKNRVEDEQRNRVLLPVLWPAIQALFEPVQQSRRAILAVHDLRHITAERHGDYYRKDDYGNWQKPHRWVLFGCKRP
jgi:hypothetical protein